MLIILGSGPTRGKSEKNKGEIRESFPTGPTKKSQLASQNLIFYMRRLDDPQFKKKVPTSGEGTWSSKNLRQREVKQRLKPTESVVGRV